MIAPTIGRILWYYPPGQSRDQQPYAAMVAHVWSDTCVNLAIWDANGMPHPQPPTRVLLVQNGGEVPVDGNYCTWMPYQLGQAARTIQAEAAATQQPTNTTPTPA